MQDLASVIDYLGRSRRLAVAAAIGLGLCSSSAFAVTNVISQSLKDWQSAAGTGRADVLILGDSTVVANGWARAIELGASAKFGLAGSGVMNAGVPNGLDSGTNTNTNNYLKNLSYDFSLTRPAGWSVLDADIPTNRSSYQPDYGQSNSGYRSSFSASAKASAVGGLGFRLGQGASSTPGTRLVPSGAYNLTVWTASQSTGSIGAIRKDSSGNTLATAANVATTTPGTGLQKSVFSFASNSTSGYQDIDVNNVTDTTLFYTRLTKSSASPVAGVTVSGWGIAGGATYHVRDRWNAMSSDGQKAYLNAILDGGGSGKLNVMIFTGINESHETPAASVTRYKNDLQGAIAAVTGTWTAMGLPASDLSFTLFGNYDTTAGGYDTTALRNYAQQAHDVAAANAAVSFVDIHDFQPANPSSYLSDGVHLSQAGAEHFGPKIFDAISVIPTSTWSSSSAGNWNTAANWSGGIPNSIDAVAQFGSTNSSPQSVFTNIPVTVGTLRIDSPNQYVIGGLGSLSLQVSSGTAAVNVLQGNHKISIPVIFASNTNITVSSGATLTIANPMTIKASKTVTQSGNVLIQAPLTIEAGGTLAIAAGATANLAGAPMLGNGASVDVRDGALVIDYHLQSSPAEVVKSQLTRGYAGGEWDGQGINSSTATESIGLGWVEDFVNQSVIVEPAFYGDANLSGSVDSADFNAYAAGYGVIAGGAWQSGDFNYDGKVDTRDFNYLSGNFGASMPPASSRIGAVVPEPSALLILLIPATAIGRHRSRARR
jgi:hypothetical protein